MLDCTIEKACYYAGISKQTYYNWKEKKILLQMRVEDEINSEEYLKEKALKNDKIEELKELRGDSEFNLDNIYNQL